MDKKIFTILRLKCCLFGPMVKSSRSCYERIHTGEKPYGWMSMGRDSTPREIGKLTALFIWFFNCNCRHLEKSVLKNVIFLFLNQNICCGCSKEPSQWDSSFEHPKQMFKLMDKKVFTILSLKCCLFGLMVKSWQSCYQRIHTGKKPFWCNVRRKRINTKRNWKTHWISQMNFKL